MRVTRRYGISGPVEFVDVEISGDNAVFLDPSAIRADPSALGRSAEKHLVSFFSEIIRLRQSTSAASLAAGRDLLSALGEVNETRLGLSRGHPRGSGVGPHYADDIWRQLSMPVVQYAALHRLEDIRLFFDGIGPDRISDITTRIIYPELVQFNHSMLNKYPTLKTKTRNQDREVYDSGTRQLITKPFLLIDPTTSTMREDCLLLVPKKWVFWRSLMDLTPFYNRFATETIQDERTTYTSDSRKLAPTKQKIKDEFPDKRELNNMQAVKYKRQGHDLVEEYRSEVLKDFTPMTDDEFKKYLGH